MFVKLERDGALGPIWVNPRHVESVSCTDHSFVVKTASGETIYTPFQRGRAPTETKEQGVRRIVELFRRASEYAEAV